jgi:hypothetical protein
VLCESQPFFERIYTLTLHSKDNMRSSSSLTITWVKPDIAAEEWEFTGHPDKQGFYQRHGLDWKEILAGFDSGRLTPYPRSNQRHSGDALLQQL